MSIVSSTSSPALGTEVAASRPGLLRIYADLTKARLSALVVMSIAVGYIAASVGPIDWTRIAWTALGTTLAAAAASVLNQLLEMKRDALMHRTRHRPLPTGAISPLHATLAGVFFALAGIILLDVFVNRLAASLALLTILLYVLVYTPLKTRSTLNTLVGAVCGAIPPMIGWAAARGTLDYGAWVLGAILFVWQIPHFLALAWMYREDYRRGGFRMLPVLDETGALTSRIVLLTSLILIPLGLVVTLAGLAGWLFALGSFLLGCWLIWLVMKMVVQCNDSNARRVFMASILYLTLLLSLLVMDRGPINHDRSALMAQEAVADISTASLFPLRPGH